MAVYVVSSWALLHVASRKGRLVDQKDCPRGSPRHPRPIEHCARITPRGTRPFSMSWSPSGQAHTGVFTPARPSSYAVRSCFPFLLALESGAGGQPLLVRNGLFQTPILCTFPYSPFWRTSAQFTKCICRITFLNTSLG